MSELTNILEHLESGLRKSVDLAGFLSARISGLRGDVELVRMDSVRRRCVLRAKWNDGRWAFLRCAWSPFGADGEEIEALARDVHMNAILTRVAINEQQHARILAHAAWDEAKVGSMMVVVTFYPSDLGKSCMKNLRRSSPLRVQEWVAALLTMCESWSEAGIVHNTLSMADIAANRVFEDGRLVPVVQNWERASWLQDPTKDDRPNNSWVSDMTRLRRALMTIAKLIDSRCVGKAITTALAVWANSHTAPQAFPSSSCSSSSSWLAPSSSWASRAVSATVSSVMDADDHVLDHKTMRQLLGPLAELFF